MAFFSRIPKSEQANKTLIVTEALEAIYQRTLLDYLCIDCAETRDGQLLVFEIDHAMVVHAMDPEDLFPYKRQHMQKVKYAFRDFLLRLTEGNQTVLE